MLDKFAFPSLLMAAALIAASGCERQQAPVIAIDDSTLAVARSALEEGVASSGAAPVSLAKPTGWGTLFGKFTLNGAAPPRSPLTIDKDVAVCAPGGKQMLDELVVVGPGNGLQNVLIYVSSPIPSDDLAWIHESYAATGGGERVFDQKNCQFLTHVAAMRSTEKMRVLNSDPVGHNTNLASKRGARAQDVLIPGGGVAVYEPGAASPTPFAVSCAIHPWMKAWMIVCDSPYFAVTKEDGSFEIANMPAGVELEMRVWQEKVTFVSAASVNGTAEKWSKGKFKLSLNPDERREMNAVIDAALLQ